MSEAEVVEQLVEFTNILLAGVSVLFTVVSAYIAALNYFIGGANFIARLLAFGFVCLILGMLVFVMMGAQSTQIGLVERLIEIDQAEGLTAAGKAIVSNAAPNEEISGVLGMPFSIDDVVRTASWTGMTLIFLVLFFMTFFHRWSTEVIPVTIEEAEPRKSR